MSARPASTEYLNFLDALRGIAALTVAVFHLHEVTARLYPNVGCNHALTRLFDYFDLGKFAVVVFFMVSGYLIPTAMERAGSVGVFAQRRFFRLYPAYWLSIACALILFHWGVNDEFVPGIAVLANLTMAQGYLGQPDCIGAFWTLQIELTFYVLCGALFWAGLFGRERWMLSPLAMLAAVAAAALRWVLAKPLPVALLLALALMFAADALRRRDRHARWCLAFIALALVPTCWLAYGQLAGRYVLTYYAGIVAFLLAWAAQAWPGFRARPLKFLADVSYSVYLLHGPLGVATALGAAAMGIDQWTGIGAGVGVTVVAAWFVFRIVEEPCIRLGRRCETRRRSVAPIPMLEPAMVAGPVETRQPELTPIDK